MAKDLVKRFIKKDGSQRISFYREEYAENPRDMTDEPLHCEDWSRNYSIMDKHERENKSSNARALLEYLLAKYGEDRKMLAELKNNYKKDSPNSYDNALAYDRREQEWRLYMWQPAHKAYDGHLIESEWECQTGWELTFDSLDMGEIVEYLSDETITNFACRYLNDKIKIMSYGFGYYGEISFDREFSTNSEGIAWLEKDEFLKYSGCKEEYWNGKSLDEIEFLLDELKAWGDNDVYGFVVEEAKLYHVTKKPNDEEELIEYDETEWNETDSCWGYYGDIDEVKVSMFDQAGLDINEFEEKNV